MHRILIPEAVLPLAGLHPAARNGADPFDGLGGIITYSSVASLLTAPPADAPSVTAAMVFLNEPVGTAFFDALPGLGLVVNLGVGTNHMDLAEARRRNIVVCNTPGALTDATADLTMALILACARHLPDADAFTRAGRFKGWDPALFLGLDLHGATLGVVGPGRIGQAVARRARAFGMEILYVSRTRLDARIEAELGAHRVQPDALAERADVVTFHCPLTEQTRGLFGKDRIARMKQGAILVNTARGPVVDESAVAAALHEGRLLSAGFDVYDGEPSINADLLAAPRMVLLPHIGSAGTRTRLAMLDMNLESLRAFFGQKTVPWTVS